MIPVSAHSPEITRQSIAIRQGQGRARKSRRLGKTWYTYNIAQARSEDEGLS